MNNFLKNLWVYPVIGSPPLLGCCCKKMNSITQKTLKTEMLKGESGRMRAMAENRPCGAAPAGKSEVRGATSEGRPDWWMALARRPFYVTRDGLGQPILDLFA